MVSTIETRKCDFPRGFAFRRNSAFTFSTSTLHIGTVDGAPSVFDPAVYYGHNEAEFGMSW
jgi:hypothetical protein